jgi:hypothetical protein
MKIHFISFVVVDEDVSWYKPVLHDVSGSYQSSITDLSPSVIETARICEIKLFKWIDCKGSFCPYDGTRRNRQGL